MAAPTAGLHLDEALLRALETRGVGRATVTLHVGPGTFRPVTAEHVEEHRVDPEWYEVPADTAERITAARRAGGRVVAVGTTSVRTLETAARAEGAARAVRAGSGWTDLYIHPPYAFAATDVLLTNFHLPRSSLLMLVSAFCEGRGGGGREWLLAAYREAVREGYRFYSYGDAMVIVCSRRARLRPAAGGGSSRGARGGRSARAGARGIRRMPRPRAVRCRWLPGVRPGRGGRSRRAGRADSPR